MAAKLGRIFFLMVLSPLTLVGQDANRFNIGFPANGVFDGSDFDTVQINNRNLHIEIPLYSVKGRGLGVAFKYVYDSKGWKFHNHCSRTTGLCTDTVQGFEPNVKLHLVTPMDYTWTGGAFVSQQCSPGFNVATYTGGFITDPSGSKHHMLPDPDTAAGPANTCWGPSNVRKYAEDGSGWVLDVPDASGNRKIISPNGTSISVRFPVYTQPNTAITDSNGNQITVDASTGVSTDTLGRSIPMYGSYYDEDGILRSFVLTSVSVPISTHLCQFSGADICYEYSGTWNLIQSIQLPDGRTYTFQYSQNSGGEPVLVTLPTGGQIAWEWVDGDEGGRAVSARTVTASDAPSGRWTYSGGLVTDPAGNQTLHSFTALRSGFQDWSILNTNQDPPLFETQVQYFAGTTAGALLKTVHTDYVATGTPLPIRETTTLNDVNLVSKTETSYDSFSAWSGNFTRRNVVSQLEYGLGTGASGGLVRQTNKTYLHDVNSQYASLNIVDKVLTDTVYDGAGSQKAQTQFEYDNYVAGVNALMSTSGAPQHDYANFPSTFIYRGNATRVSGWRNTDNALLTTTSTYDDLGNLRAVADPLSHTTSYSYNDSFANSYCLPAGNSMAYLSQVTDALNHRVQTVRYPCTGLMQSRKDENDILAGRAGTTFTYDLMDRPLTTSFPDGGLTTMSYNNAAPFTATATRAISSSANLVTTSIFDNLGRVKETMLTSDPEGVVYVYTTYDALGRTATVSNPYRNLTEPTYGLTQYAYDALGRTTALTRQNNDTVQTAYSGNVVTVTDETGRQRRSISDALGRLTTVWEPDPTSGSLAFETDYQYDTLNNLLRVDQKGGSGDSSQWRTRTFAYDSLSRLTSASNPESGGQSYTYDAAGNVLTKTDARGIVATSSYDALNRILTRNFSDGTNGYDFNYDWPSIWGVSTGASIGRLVWADRHIANLNQNAVNNFAYDAMGRATTQFGCTPGSCYIAAGYTINATYNLAGDMTSLTYPSGRVVNYTYNAANRNTVVTFQNLGGAGNPYQYLSVPQHYASGADYVSNFGNGITQTLLLNNRLQDKQITFSNPAYGTLSDLAYTFTDPVTGKNNGNVYSIADQLNSSRTQNFGYDKLNRLTSAQTAGTLWGNTYVIDAWGNLTQKNQVTGKAAGEYLQATALSNNRLASYTYDAGGNMINDGIHSYQFDADNQVTRVDGGAATYTPGADGQRVRKQANGVSTEYIRFNGEVLAEWNGAADWSDYIYAEGKRIARGDNYEDRIMAQGTNCANCGWQYVNALLKSGGQYILNGYVVQAGDKVFVRQWQNTGSHGGVIFAFTDGTWSGPLNQRDQDGEAMWDDSRMNAWHKRVFDMTAVAGKTISSVQFGVNGDTAAGLWTIYYKDFVLLSADGTVHKIYSGDKSATIDVYPSAGMTGVSYGVQHAGGQGIYADATTTFYHGDHLGSSRLLSGPDGYPTWQGTYYPYGAEYIAPGANNNSTVNNYKFTGKERDAESGLDYFGARYYSSLTSRWLTPDWSATPEPVPYAVFGDPQSLNQYGYVRNNPMSYADADGHEIPGGGDNLNFDQLKFLGQELVGAGKGLINALPEIYNTGAGLLNAQGVASGQPYMEVPLAPTLPINNLGEAVGAGVATLALVAAGGVRSAPAEEAGAAAEPHPSISNPYERPTGATTAEQRVSVQGKPCVDCGKVEPKMNANHKTPLVQEYYKTGTIDKTKMRSTDMVNSQCPTCSAKQGGKMSQYSKKMKVKIK